MFITCHVPVNHATRILPENECEYILKEFKNVLKSWDQYEIGQNYGSQGQKDWIWLKALLPMGMCLWNQVRYSNLVIPISLLCKIRMNISTEAAVTQ